MRITNDHKYGHLVTYKFCEPGMRKRRESLFPKIPKTIYDIPELMKQAPNEISSIYQGLLRLPDRTPIGVLMYDKRLFNILKRKKHLAYDGTFFVVPSPFYQLWNLFFIQGNQYFPAVSVLFTGKHTDMYRSFWRKMKQNDQLGPDFLPDSIGGDMELAAQIATEEEMIGLLLSFCAFHYSQANIHNSQKHGLSNAYKTNNDYHTWLKLILAVNMLPSGMITYAFRYLLSQEIKFEKKADQMNFKNFKKYVAKQWANPKKMKPENLTCFKREQSCNNGPECFNGFLRREVQVQHCNIWTFMVIFKRILRFEYKQYQRLVTHGEGKVTRGRKNHTENNIKNRRTAENELVKGKISWLVFLQRVSHTNDSMVARLEEDFRQNGDEVDDPRVQLDTNHNNDSLCARCNIEIDRHEK